MTVWWQQACTISLSGSTMVITSLMSHEIQSFYTAHWSSSLKRGWKFRAVRMIQPPELMRPCYLYNSCHNFPVLWPILSGFCISSCILNLTRHPLYSEHFPNYLLFLISLPPTGAELPLRAEPLGGGVTALTRNLTVKGSLWSNASDPSLILLISWDIILREKTSNTTRRDGESLRRREP